MSHSPTTTLDWKRADLWGPPRVRQWTGGVIVQAALLVVIASLVAGVPAIWMLYRTDANPLTVLNHPVVLISGLVGLWVVFAGYPLRVSRTRGTRSLARDMGWAFERRDLLFGLLAGLGLRGADVLIGLGVSALVELPESDNASWVTYPHPLALTIFFILGAAVIAPALEELFFRGLLMRTFARLRRVPARFSNALAVAASSLMFGVMHLTGLHAGGLYVVTMTGLIGAILAVITLRKGRLGPAVATHIVFNSTGVALAFLG